eukprot:CAMPEP_0201509072 /NCGR_PEP_ID=MMETSP0161_2-20130828/2219_1 /ASSEMBLY_ACC=CAM_ASM_000251 /TAXON_ID=180227 /ORGANISM="Neoparamoeba aestuarina, Strain SoJaBio B1-5/56/2" /LENGTH=291 /DNA_ID=CAMNT_0047903919 /DNA_START=204 /DNA_END=1079 /DNA_ORIENTATION=+
MKWIIALFILGASFQTTWGWGIEPEADKFTKVARTVFPHSDKVTHGYGRFYTQHVLDMYQGRKDNVLLKAVMNKPEGESISDTIERVGKEFDQEFKLLQIGLGCENPRTTGATLSLWKKLFPNSQIFIFNQDEICTINFKSQNKALTEGVTFIQGNQSKIEDLKKMAPYQPFDVIIDDGGHTMVQQQLTLLFCFQYVTKKTGVMIVEDLRTSQLVSRYHRFNYNYQKAPMEQTTRMAVVNWVEDLVKNGELGIQGMVIDNENDLEGPYRSAMKDELAMIAVGKSIAAFFRK